MNDRALLPAQNPSLLEAGIPILNLILGMSAFICLIVLFVCFWSTLIWGIVEGTREIPLGQKRSYKKTLSSLIVGLCALGGLILLIIVWGVSVYFATQSF